MRIQSAVVLPLAQSQLLFPVAPGSTHDGVEHIQKLVELFDDRLRNLARVSVLPKYRGRVTYRTAMQTLYIQDRNAVNCEFNNGLATSLADGSDEFGRHFCKALCNWSLRSLSTHQQHSLDDEKDIYVRQGGHSSRDLQFFKRITI